MVCSVASKLETARTERREPFNNQVPDAHQPRVRHETKKRPIKTLLGRKAKRDSNLKGTAFRKKAQAQMVGPKKPFESREKKADDD
jgi:hypothetical protein